MMLVSRPFAVAVLMASVPSLGSAQGTVTTIGSFACGENLAGGIDLFGVTVFTVGTAIWRTDGTVAGTFYLADRGLFGPYTEPLRRMGDHIYFTSFDAATGEELWRTDGTAAGTGRVRDTLPGYTSLEPRGLTPLGNRLVFSGKTPPSGGIEPYVSDGTFGGTRLLIDLRPGATGSNPHSFVSLGDRALFLADDGIHGNEFWTTDGTAAGTALVSDFEPGPNGTFVDYLGALGPRTFWIQGSYSNVRLVTTDGTAAGTKTLKRWSAQLAAYYPLGGFVEVAGRSYFTVSYYNWNSNTSVELWSTDGTADGTVGHGVIWPLAFRTGNATPRLWPLGSRVLCVGESATEGREPWIFEPATGQFSLVADFAPGTASSSVVDAAGIGPKRAILLLGGSLSKTAWLIDPSGSSAPVVLRTDVDSLIPIGARYVWFVGQDGALGYEFWRTDGTITGTQRVGGEAVAGTAGVWIDRHVLSGGNLIVFGQRRVSANSYQCAPQLWSVQPDAHTIRLGEAGAGGGGAATLSCDDPVLGSTMRVRVAGLDHAPQFALTVDTFSNRATWLGSFWFYSGFTTAQVLTVSPANGGVGTAELTVPATPALAGLRLHLQGFGLGPVEPRASNGLLLLLGN